LKTGFPHNLAGQKGSHSFLSYFIFSGIALPAASDFILPDAFSACFILNHILNIPSWIMNRMIFSGRAFLRLKGRS
jgi:hypothetical protein